jgi:hypothetical protein
LLVAFLLGHPAVAADLPFTGAWVINAEETDKVRVPFKKDKANLLSSGRVSSSVSVGGVALPLPGSARPQPMSNLSPKDPKVLRCTRMQITPKGKKMLLAYDDADKETLVKGHYRGRDTKWSKSKIEQKYKTSERRVTKSWTLREDGRLLVSVVLNPIGERKRVYNRVFDRVQAPQATAEKASSQPG